VGGVAIPNPEIVASASYYGLGRRFGWYGSLRYSLDPAASSRVTGSSETGYATVVDQVGKVRVEGGVAWRFGG
jgi:hypothetical protein